MLFSEHNIQNGIKNENKSMRELYTDLSFDEKYKWVVKAVSLAPEVYYSLYTIAKNSHNKMISFDT